ncbi:alpha/beta hydrolase-fold protein [Mangrovivirga sp. M17]|uniref:Alpha/beta hydrolase-fold protein n=1 Tax=Mangrovivirga halotolerans TaxID=2993936 RepID=A0ABT3RV17_9BACT|nr:alpha/beta hydrolase-fold protein [Mangrovivirga halotolerans]MCX2745610.1 alpha/beta hydrolase-fold protein [Mangrovivirga halotolerans]
MKSFSYIIKFNIPLIVLFIFILNIAEAQSEVGIPNSKSIKLYSPAVKDSFSISIAFPENYSSDNKDYPVIYLTDPFFIFGSTVESARALAYDGKMPEAIIVGIGYTGPQKFRRIMQLRTRDYTPQDRFVLPNGVEPKWAKEMEMGKAKEFLQFIRNELFTYLHDNYRVTDHRTYIGFSGGAYFGHYILFHEPGLFNQYLLSSPGYWYEAERKFEGNLFEYEEKYAANNDSLNARIFISVGENESHYMVGGMVKMVQILKSRNYEGLQVHSHIFSDQSHYSVFPVAVNNGLRILFNNYDAQATGGLNEIN